MCYKDSVVSPSYLNLIGKLDNFLKFLKNETLA